MLYQKRNYASMKNLYSSRCRSCSIASINLKSSSERWINLPPIGVELTCTVISSFNKNGIFWIRLVQDDTDNKENKRIFPNYGKTKARMPKEMTMESLFQCRFRSMPNGQIGFEAMWIFEDLCVGNIFSVMFISKVHLESSNVYYFVELSQKENRVSDWFGPFISKGIRSLFEMNGSRSITHCITNCFNNTETNPVLNTNKQSKVFYFHKINSVESLTESYISETLSNSRTDDTCTSSTESDDENWFCETECVQWTVKPGIDPEKQLIDYYPFHTFKPHTNIACNDMDPRHGDDNSNKLKGKFLDSSTPSHDFHPNNSKSASLPPYVEAARRYHPVESEGCSLLSGIRSDRGDDFDSFSPNYKNRKSFFTILPKCHEYIRLPYPEFFVAGTRFTCRIHNELTETATVWVECILCPDMEERFQNLLTILSLHAISEEGWSRWCPRDLVCVSFCGVWHRGVVLKLLNDKLILLRLIDLGNSIVLPTTLVRSMPKDCGVFPPKAILCKLAGLTEINVYASKIFNSLVSNHEICATVVFNNPLSKKPMEVNLNCFSRDGISININKILSNICYKKSNTRKATIDCRLPPLPFSKHNGYCNQRSFSMERLNFNPATSSSDCSSSCSDTERKHRPKFKTRKGQKTPKDVVGNASYYTNGAALKLPEIYDQESDTGKER